MATDSADRSGYLPGLDGIRAIAVGSVVAYHLRAPFFDGGLLGVSVFFTLSGYLITSLLVRGFDERGRAELKTFWIRRANLRWVLRGRCSRGRCHGMFPR